MSESFDYDLFDRRCTRLAVHSADKPFIQLAGEIDALRQEYEGIRDEVARTYVHRELDRSLLRFAIDTRQPSVLVDRLYQQNLQQGFNDLHAEVAASIEYAHYCSEQGNVATGLSALQ